MFIKQKVVKISKIKERGVFAPMTTAGNLIVNDILASCNVISNYGHLQNDFFQVKYFF